jgi:hypothetical protein
MAIKYGKTEVVKMAKALEPGYSDLTAEQKDDLHAMAESALAAATEILVGRAKFTVVGQLHSTPHEGWESHEEAEAARGALGFYSTEGEATKAAESLFYSASSQEQWRTWVLPMSHVSPADFHSQRKEKREAAQAKARAEKGRLDVEAQEKRMVEEMAEFVGSLSPEETAALQERVDRAVEIAAEREAA